MDVDTYHRRRSELAGLPMRPYEPPASKHLLLRQRRFHYLEWGKKGTPCIVFLHGGGQTAWTWDTVCQQLAPDYHCVALDLRGHGDSEWAYDRDYQIDQFVDDVAAFLELMPDRPVLAGMSLGGLTAMGFAVKHSRHLSGLVCVDVGPEVNVSAAQPIRDFVQKGFSLSQFDAFVEAASAFNPRRSKDLLSFSLRRNLRQLQTGDLTWKTDPEFRGAIDQVAAQLGAIGRRIGQITCPVLVVRGAESDIFSDAQASAFAQAVPDGEWRAIPKAGHSIQGDNPQGLIEALKEFYVNRIATRSTCEDQ